ncbi:MAG: TIGR04282 family arsenosugar biosynthesis glycosyltransferase [Pseudomonadales bacterium]
MSDSNALIQIFARAPVLGRVKRRLAEDVGHNAALHWYRILLTRTLTAARSLAQSFEGVAIEVWHPPFDDDFALTELLGDATLRLFPQAEGDLGVKMQSALTDGLNRANRVLLMGADCPVWTRETLSAVFGSLRAPGDCTLVPAEDGGYVGIGVMGGVPEIFSGIDWGTSAVLNQTRRQGELRGVTLSELSPLWDIDVVADLERWLALEPHLPRPIG